MEEVEFNAKINLYARQLGTVDEIPCAELEKLMDLRKKFNLPGKHPGCKKCPNLGTDKCHCKDNLPKAEAHTCTCNTPSPDDALVAEITKKVMAALGR